MLGMAAKGVGRELGLGFRAGIASESEGEEELGGLGFSRRRMGYL
jgi:hypothetical protein